MKPSLRSLFQLLVIPPSGALLALLIASSIPFVIVQNDIRAIERDLQYAAAAREFARNFTAQSREYSDLAVLGEEQDIREIRGAADRCRVALARWQALAAADGTPELQTLREIENAHASVTQSGERLIGLVRAGRKQEAADIVTAQIYPAVRWVSVSVDENIFDHQARIDGSVARIVGGVRYSRVLRLGHLEESIEDLDVHVSQSLQSGMLRKSVEREIRAYWYYTITGNREHIGDIAVNRADADRALSAWRAAIASFGHGGRASAHTRQEELRFVRAVESEYRIARVHGDDLMRLLDAGRRDDAARVLTNSLAFERMHLSTALADYSGRRAVIAAQNLAKLKREAQRVRTLILTITGLTLLLGIGLPLILSRKLIAPILGLQRAAQRIGDGDLDARVEVPAVREMAQLATAFNRMANDLRTSLDDLHRSEERFQFAGRATNDVIWDLDVATGTTWVSDEFRRRYGFPDGPITTQIWVDHIHPEDQEAALQHFESGLMGRDEYWAIEYRFRLADGSYAFVHDRAYIMRDATGAPVRMIGAMANTTDRKRAEEAFAELMRLKEMILESVADGILGVDADGRVISANAAAAQALGCEVSDLIGVSITSILGDPPANRGSLVEETLLRSDGSSFPVEYTSSAMSDAQGNVVGAVVTFRDITERHEVDRIKSEFVSTVSHELRTPLTSIRGALGLLRGGLLGEIPEKGQRMLQIAVSNTDRLVRLINDILDIEKLESGQIRLQCCEVEIAPLMEQAVEVMKAMADKAGVSIVLRCWEGTAFVDEDRLMQTLTNLVSNAIKFSPPATTIHVAADAVDGELHFAVSDEGRGIPEDKLETIFARFQQIDASDSRDKGGTGLGLAICRSIVQQHGGRIWAESVLGEGSTFRVVIPFQAQPTIALSSIGIADGHLHA